MTPFRTQRTLRFGDCDPSGIAYFPAYFNILVGVVEEYFASAGAPWTTMFADLRIGVPTVRLDVTFSAPGMHGDLLDWELTPVKVGRSSVTLMHRVTRGGTTLWAATQVLVATNLATHTSTPWPDAIRTGLVRSLVT